ncbi:MAG TPA: hypothetical protein VLC09_01700 [Polyangiaceae bacterium]|nr:hypothetical protein [Polyangiaceae bacterium]
MGLVDTIRRVFWLLPVLIVGAASLFAAFSSTIAPPPAGSALFFNPRPRQASSEAEAALQRFLAAEDGADAKADAKADANAAEDAAARLVRLGGAALPHLLERIDSLPPDQARRLADALWPIAERMGSWESETLALTDARDAKRSERRLEFWRDFRDEHASDFRPLVVQRLVRRLSARDLSLRRADLLVVDTYALPALIDQLGRVQTNADVERVQRVAALIAHVRGQEFRGQARSVVAARRLASQLRGEWDREGPDYTSLNGVEQLAASLSQTEFAIWVRRSLRQLTKVDDSALGERLARGAAISAPSFLLALLGALVLGPALAAWLQVLEMSRKVPRAGRLSVRLGLALAVCSLLPGALLEPTASAFWRGSLALLAGTLPSTFLLSHELGQRVDWRTHRLLRRRRSWARVRAIWRWLGPSLPTLSPLVAAEAAFAVACLEIGSNRPGLGLETWRAAQTGDLPWLMLSSLALGLFTGSTQLLCDAVLGTRRFAWWEAD